MPIQTLVARRLYRQIADQLRGSIRDGEFGVGNWLPPERDLALQLGVSRSSVRKAMIALEVEGLVAVRPGSGTVVIAQERAARAPQVDAAFGPSEIIRARQVVECALAAQQMDAAGVDGLHEALALIAEDVAAGRPATCGDRLFHLRTAEVADNGPLLRSVTELFDERNNPLFEQLDQHFETAPTWRLALAKPAAVISAIARADADADAARAAMFAHLQQPRNRFAGTWPQASVDLACASNAAGNSAARPPDLASTQASSAASRFAFPQPIKPPSPSPSP